MYINSDKNLNFKKRDMTQLADFKFKKDGNN